VCPSRLSTGSSKAKPDDTISENGGTRPPRGAVWLRHQCDIDKGAQPMSICRQNGAADFSQLPQISATAGPGINRPPGRPPIAWSRSSSKRLPARLRWPASDTA
jgi:hypothetical protein